MDRGIRTRRIGAVALVATMALAVGVAQAGAARVNGSNYAFKPKTVTIDKGQRVVWKWVNGSHTVTFRNGTSDKSLNRANPLRARTFKQHGTFRYYCRNHTYFGMTGKVVVE